MWMDSSTKGPECERPDKTGIDWWTANKTEQKPQPTCSISHCNFFHNTVMINYVEIKYTAAFFKHVTDVTLILKYFF